MAYCTVKLIQQIYWYSGNRCLLLDFGANNSKTNHPDMREKLKQTFETLHLGLDTEANKDSPLLFLLNVDLASKAS